MGTLTATHMDTGTPMTINTQQPTAVSDLALLGLLQLISPALPIGAFAWSQGLESAFELGWAQGDSQSLLGFAWAWLENQLAAACKAMPLGHTAAQRLNEQLRPKLVTAVDVALSLTDDQLGPILPGLALGSAHHETQYSRLFRS